MKTAVKDTIKTITTHYIDGAFVESHGREVMDIIRPTDRQVIARVTLGGRRGYATRHRRRKARICDIRPVNNRRTRARFCAGCMKPPRRE